MGKWLGILTILVVIGGVGYYVWPKKIIDPIGSQKQTENLNLERYDFDSLRKYRSPGGEIKILGEIPEVTLRRKNLNDKQMKYDFTTREIRFQSEGKWISGMINYFPEKSSLSKVVIMIRGYAEKVGYYPGSGTWRVADELAKEGYVTISLDFLGYGHSDMESTDILEARFLKVIEVLDLIESVKQLPWVDKDGIGIWAHSNGGQIALSVLEITGANYPTILWAPMTQPFPESVLSTIDPDSPVKGAIEEFESHYDSRRYAFENYYQWINAPILIQQGSRDDQVKVEWQEEVAAELKKLNKQVDLVIYPGADHNLAGAKGKYWKQAVERDVEWYTNQVQ